MNTFGALWPGRCDECERRIVEGDEIGFVDGYARPLCKHCHDTLCKHCQDVIWGDS